MTTFRPQLKDPTTTLDSYLCTMESAAMALDYQTGGVVSKWGGELVPYCGLSAAQIKGQAPRADGKLHVGTNLENAKLAWAHFGETLEIRTGQGWAGVVAALNEGRGVILQGDYDQMGAYSCQSSFLGDHAIFIAGSFAAVGDPLCKGFRPVPEATLRAYATKLAPTVYFAVTKPQKESAVFLPGRIVRQSWTANGTNGVLRAKPDRSLAPFATIPAGQTIISDLEGVTDDGNNWRGVVWPVGNPTNTIGAYFLRTGPGIPPDHDFIAGAILTTTTPAATVVTVNGKVVYQS